MRRSRGPTKYLISVRQCVYVLKFPTIRGRVTRRIIRYSESPDQNAAQNFSHPPSSRSFAQSRSRFRIRVFIFDRVVTPLFNKSLGLKWWKPGQARRKSERLRTCVYIEERAERRLGRRRRRRRERKRRSWRRKHLAHGAGVSLGLLIVSSPRLSAPGRSHD